MIVIFEGLDACGKSSHSIAIKKKFESAGWNVELSGAQRPSGLRAVIRNLIAAEEYLPFESLSRQLLEAAIVRHSFPNVTKYDCVGKNVLILDRFVETIVAYGTESIDEQIVLSRMKILEQIFPDFNHRVTVNLCVDDALSVSRIEQRKMVSNFDKNAIQNMRRIRIRYNQIFSAYGHPYRQFETSGPFEECNLKIFEFLLSLAKHQ
jgi:thymidylate kinase